MITRCVWHKEFYYYLAKDNMMQSGEEYQQRQVGECADTWINRSAYRDSAWSCNCPAFCQHPCVNQNDQ